MKNCHTVRHGHGFGLVVGDVHHSEAKLVVQALDFILQLLAQLFVQRRQRLIHQHQLGLEHQGSRYRHPLLLAARHLGWPAALETTQTHLVQCLVDAVDGFTSFDAAHREGEGHILSHTHMWKQSVILKHHANVAMLWRNGVDRSPVEVNLARSGRLKASQHHQRGGLA